MAQTVKSVPAMQETWVQSLGWEDPLERAMSTHSSNLAWNIPWQEEPGRYSPRGHKELDTTEGLHFHFDDCMFSFCFLPWKPLSFGYFFIF